MKKNLLIVIMLFLALLCKAEEKVFPTSDAIWVIHMYYGSNGSEQLVYGLSGDTIIDTKTYQKLYLLSDTTLIITNEDTYVGGIHQENKKVWMLPADQSDGTAFEEFLLYDFGAKEGEIINFGKKLIMGASGPGINYRGDGVFENIQVEYLSDIEGKVWSVRESEYGGAEFDVEIVYAHNFWIKGIGSTNGLFFGESVPTLCRQSLRCMGSSAPYGANLICMKEIDEIKYLKKGCKSCFNEILYDYSSIENEFAQNNPKVNYNPIVGSITIESETANLPFNFKLYSIDGTQIGTYTITDTYTELNINKQLNGIYIYNITGQNVTHGAKLVVK